MVGYLKRQVPKGHQCTKCNIVYTLCESCKVESAMLCNDTPFMRFSEGKII